MKRALPGLLVLVPALAAAEPTERRLHADQATASSFLWNDWNRFQENYHPLYVSDDDPRTAWTEGAPSAGEGEWIRLQLTDMEGATRVRLMVRNGYHKSHSLFLKNGRVREATIKLLPSEKTTKVTLADAEGWQEAIAEQPAGKLQAVELRVDSVYPGSKYSDLCISDIQVFVTAETRENPAFEKSKLAKVLAWKAERLQAAKLFKEASKELPLLPSYQTTFAEGGAEAELWEKCAGDQVCWARETLAIAKDLEKDHAAAFALARDALAGKGVVPGRLAPTDSRPIPAVDGVYVPSLYSGIEPEYSSGLELPIAGAIASLQAEKLGPIQLEGADVKATLPEVLKNKAPGCRSKAGQTYVWLAREKVASGDDAGRERLRGLLLARCGRVEVRDGHEDVAVLQVAVYDEKGRLELLAGQGYVDAFRWLTTAAHPTIAGGKAVYFDGRTAEMTEPMVAKAP